MTLHHFEFSEELKVELIFKLNVLLVFEHKGHPIEKIPNRCIVEFKKEIHDPWKISHSRIKFNFTTQCPNIVSFSLCPKHRFTYSNNLFSQIINLKITVLMFSL